MPMPRGYRKDEDFKAMEKAQVAALLHAARSIERDPRAYLMFALMYLLGLRIGEATQLKWEYLGPLNAKGEPICVRVPTLKQRQDSPPLLTVPVLSHHNLVLAAFDRRRLTKDQRRARSPWLFPGDNGTKPLSHTQAYRVWEHCREAARLDARYTPHCLRHTAATTLARAGVPKTPLIVAFLRHKTRGDATDVYIHATPTEWVKWRGVLDLPPLAPIS